jgi:pilus assembly protein Flp/PilA
MLEYIGLRLAMALADGGSLRDRVRRDEGQTLVEYALILVTIAVVVVAAMTFLEGKISDLFTDIGNQLD